MNKHILFGLAIILIVIIADQLSKWWILEFYSRGDGSPLGLDLWITQNERLSFKSIEILSFFNLVMVWNEGVSFGLFAELPNTHIYLSVLSAAISLALVVWMFKTNRVFNIYILAMIIGGALGNVIDRIRFGAVADFIDIHAFGYHWPAFNLADSMITIGVALLLIDGLFFDKSER